MIRHVVVAALVSALIIACEAASPATTAPLAPTSVVQVSPTEVPAPAEPTPAPTATPVPPSAAFSVDIDSGSAPVTVHFSNSSDGTITSRVWDFGDDTTSTDPSPSHNYTIAGTYTVQLKISGPDGTDTRVILDLVTVLPGPLVGLEVSPSSATLAVQEVVQFSAVGRDEFRNAVTLPVTPTWSIVASGGSISSSGRFTAGEVARTYPLTVRASLQTDTGEVVGLGTVTVKPGPATKVVLKPAEIAMDIGATQQFTFIVFDEFANQISDVLNLWIATPNVGVVDASGVLTTGEEAGLFLAAIRVDVVNGTDRFSATADVTIRPGPLAEIKVEPPSAMVEKRTTERFAAAGFDQFGNAIPWLEFLWSATGGRITQTGLFTAGGPSGIYEVSASGKFGDSAVTGAARVEIHQESLQEIYAALKLEELRADKVSYIRGERPFFTYKLVNRSGRRLIIPVNEDYSRPFHLVGVLQHWIQRLGDDSNIPSISGISSDAVTDYAGPTPTPAPASTLTPRYLKSDADGKFAAGGHIIVVDEEWEPSMSQAFRRRLNHDTTGFPPGRYRYYVEYKTLSNKVVQIATIDFLIK